MDLVICIIVLYIVQLRATDDANLPNHLSYLINKLIKETENKSDSKTKFEVIEPDNLSKIIYMKEKSNPKVIWKVKYEDITDKRIEDEKKKTFPDFVNRKNKNNVHDNVMTPKDMNKTSISNSLEYTSESVPEKSKLKDLSPINEEVTTESSQIIESLTHPGIIASDKNSIKESEQILHNLTKLISSKNSDDTLNIMKLNKNYEGLLKEIQEIKTLHKVENLKDNIDLFHPPVIHGTALSRFGYPDPDKKNTVVLPHYRILPNYRIVPTYRIIPNVDASSSKQIIYQMPLYRNPYTNYVPALVKKSILANYREGSTFTSHVGHVMRDS